MKFLCARMIMFSILSVVSNSHFALADFRTCGKRLESDSEAMKSIEYLRSVSGRYRLGSCKIELHVCSRFSEEKDRSSLIADLLITDSKGFERYIPIHFPGSTTPSTDVIRINHSRAFHYEFFDRISDPFHGRFESYRLEIVKTQSLKAVEYLEAGFTSSRERKAKVHKAWINCGGSNNSGGVRGRPVKIEGVLSEEK